MCEGGQVWGHARRRGSARLAILFLKKTPANLKIDPKVVTTFRGYFWTIFIKIHQNFKNIFNKKFDISFNKIFTKFSNNISQFFITKAQLAFVCNPA